MPSTRTTTLAAVAVAAGLLLTACSGGSSGTSSGATAAAPAAASGSAAAAAPALDSAASAAGGLAPGATEAAPAASAAAAGAGSSGTTSSGTTLSASAPRLIRNAQVSFEVTNLIDAANRVRAAATAFNGGVSSETTGYSADAKPLPVDNSSPATGQPAVAGQSVIVLRVPEPQLDNAIASLTGVNGKGGVGTLLTRTASSQDVTGDVADLTSRVATAKASVARVRVLLDKAERLQDIVLLESELTRRESDLEALQARQASLAGRADLSTLTVSVQTPAVEVQVTPDNGFVTGLKSGWHSLTRSAVAVLDVVGAVLPWLLLAGLVAWPSYVIVRRRRTRRTHPSPPPFEPSGQSGPSGPGEGSPAPEAQRPDLDPVP